MNYSQQPPGQNSACRTCRARVNCSVTRSNWLPRGRTRVMKWIGLKSYINPNNEDKLHHHSLVQYCVFQFPRKQEDMADNTQNMSYQAGEAKGQTKVSQTFCLCIQFPFHIMQNGMQDVILIYLYIHVCLRRRPAA